MSFIYLTCVFLTCRRESSNGLQDSRLDEENITVNSPDRVETPCKLELDKSRDKSHEKGIMIENVENTTGSNPQSWKQKDTSGCCKTNLADAFNGPQKMEVDDSSMVPLQNERSCKNISSTIQVVKHHIENLEKDTPRSKPQSREQKDTTGCCKTSLADAFNGPQKIEVDDSPMVPSQNREPCKNILSTIQVSNMTSCNEKGLNCSASNVNVKV